MDNKVLIVDKIVKKYPRFLLDSVSFELPEATITGFIGKNGAGKSTTLKAIMKLIKPDSGNISFGMDKVNNAYPIGYLGMEKGIYPDERLENIAKFVGKSWGKSWNQDNYRYYVETVFGLNTNQKMKELSTGMVVKFLLSVELAKSPRLLLLDEPTSGLDPIVREEILTILEGLVDKKRITVLFSSHITEDIVKIADRVIFINNGKIVLQDSKESVLQRYVKMKKQDVEKLPGSVSSKISKNGVSNRDYFIWDNVVQQVNDPHMEKVALDEILIALGGKEND
ncbi:MAG: ABC transporter ATP-binding protein [Lachnospiraceae bacterium]